MSMCFKEILGIRDNERQLYLLAIIALDKASLQPNNHSLYFLISPAKTHNIGTHWKRLSKVFLVNTRHICLCDETNKYLPRYLSRALLAMTFSPYNMGNEDLL